MVRQQYNFIIQLCDLTDVLLHARFDVSLRFPNIETVAILNFTRNLVHSSSGSASKAVAAAVCTFSVNFELLRAIAWSLAEVSIHDAKQEFTM